MVYLEVFLVLTLLGLSSAKTEEPDMAGKQHILESGNMRVKVAEKAGIMKIWRELERQTNNGTRTVRSHPIFVLMDELIERDAEFNPVGRGGTSKHSFKSFATQDFSFSAIKDTTIPGSTVGAKSMTYSGVLGGLTSTFNSTLYISKEDGNVTVGDESFEILKGQVKFTVELSNWEFCGCQKAGVADEGKYIDFTLTLKMRPGRKANRAGGKEGKKRPSFFNLGDGSEIVMSKKVELDGVWKTMPEGYPKHETRGSKQYFTIRFEKFNSTALYDPTIETGNQAEDEGTESVDASASALVTSFLTLTLGLLAGTKPLY